MVNRVERFLLGKVPVWSIGLICLMAILSMIAFGNVAIHTFKGGTKAGQVGEVVLTLSNLPSLIKRLNNADSYLRVRDDPAPEQNGFDFSYGPETRAGAGYLLLSRYDGDDRRAYVEYWDLNAQKLLHRWAPPINEINAASNLQAAGINLARDKNVQRMLIRHPAVTENGEILIKSRTPISLVDMCSQVVWSNDSTLFHHAIETDDEGFHWVASRIEPTKIPLVDPVNFIDDAITRVSPEGDVVYQKSVSGILIANGMERYVYGRASYEDNPIHLNDIQPVEADGPHWKKGDLFLSLRSHSLIMLYRPETDKVVWYKEGPWLHQHDVDILDDHRISIFDNSTLNGWRRTKVMGHSSVRVFDFDTGLVTAPWDEALAALDFRTETEGLHQIRANGDLFVEEQNRGRLLQLDRSGNLVWSYVNRAGNGEIYRVGWSRILETEEGTGIAKVLETGTCG